MANLTLNWYKVCNQCGFFEKGETEYIGFSFWFCTKCNSRHLRIKIIVEGD